MPSEKRFVNFGGIFDLPQLTSDLEHLELEATHPDFWKDPQAAARLSRKKSAIEREIIRVTDIERRYGDLQAMIEQTVLNLAVIDHFAAVKLDSPISPGQFWEHGIACGIIAAELAHNIDGEDPDSAFTLGLLTGLTVTGDALLLLGTGLLGAFTTFSTWMLEAQRLGEEGELRVLAAYLVTSLLAGLAAAGLGWAIA
jgi:fluoride ion exporter CrcB/FEX